MRISTRMLSDTLINNLQANLQRLEQTQNELSSGKRLRKPSDDPAAVGRALIYRTDLATGNQYLSTIQSSLDWLNANETALASMTENLQRVRELAVQGGNDTLDQNGMADIAAEVDQLLQHMVSLGNADLRGQRLFAGLKTDANPFTLNAGPPTTVTYNGDAGQMVREIDRGVTVTINIPGSTFLPAAFTALTNLRDHLRAADSAAVRADISSVDAALGGVLAARGNVGALTNRVQAAQDRQEGLNAEIQKLLSNVEDTDFTDAITRAAAQENVYKAALGVGAKAIQSSLLDYLR